MSKEEFIEKARELNYTEKDIEDFVQIAEDSQDPDFNYGVFPLFYQEPQEKKC